MKNASPFHQACFCGFSITASDMRQTSKQTVWAKYRFALWLCQGSLLLLCAGLQAGSEPPIKDHIRLVAAALLKGQSADSAVFEGEWSKLPSKKLPASVAIYLKPTKSTDYLSAPVEKAAQQVLRSLGAGDKSHALEDPALLAAALRAWLDSNIANQAPEDEEPRAYATDPRLVEPKASEILKRAWAGPQARVRLRVALLRALKVPARECWFRGQLGVQYWAAYLRNENGPKPKPAPKKKGSKANSGPTQPKGEWVLDETCFPGETVDAWSMDPGGLDLATWTPAQELELDSRVERAYYAVDESATAQGDLNYVRDHGHLPTAARKRAAAPRPGRAGKAKPWLMLVLHDARFTAEGSLAYLSPIEWMLPYRPALKNWGSEAKPSPESFESLGQVFWTDRPERVRAKNAKARDDWRSPPPAYGMLHDVFVSVHRPDAALDAELGGKKLSGKILRADSLAPKAGASVKLEFRTPDSSRELKANESGEFETTLSPTEASSAWVYVSGGSGEASALRWDGLLLELN
jgi:hypothetical protein